GGQGDVATVAILNELSMCARGLSDLAGSQRVLDEGGAMLRRLGQEQSVLYVRLLTNYGRLEMGRGDSSAAKKYYEQALALARDLRGARDPEYAEVLVEQSLAMSWEDDLSAAERLVGEAVDIYGITLPKQHPDRVYAQFVFGETVRVRGKLVEAAAIL